MYVAANGAKRTSASQSNHTRSQTVIRLLRPSSRLASLLRLLGLFSPSVALGLYLYPCDDLDRTLCPTAHPRPDYGIAVGDDRVYFDSSAEAGYPRRVDQRHVMTQRVRQTVRPFIPLDYLYHTKYMIRRLILTLSFFSVVRL